MAAATQIPQIEPGTQVTPRKVPPPPRPGGTPATWCGFVWGVRFRLPQPAANDGFIIQQIRQLTIGADSSGGPVSRLLEYWEAWKVNRGEKTITDPAGEMSLATMLGHTGSGPDHTYHLKLNDIFLRKLSGGRGDVVYRACAGFYEVPLPRGFAANNGATGAGQLPSTLHKPTFWDDAGLFRMLHFHFDFTTGVSPANALLSTTTAASESIANNEGTFASHS